jgi:branched-subunit amino acid transport protein
MTVELVWLALLMAAVTYPARAVPLLVPGIERLPTSALDFLRLVGPATLAALAAVNAFTVVVDGRPTLSFGVLGVGVVAGLVVVLLGRGLLLGLLMAAATVALLRAAGVG